MNIFVLDRDPKKCAEYHADKHVVKMVLETAQLLCCAVSLSGGKAPYKTTHKNHPCSIWARESLDNWRWLRSLGVELGKEFTHRFGKQHKSHQVICLLDEPELPQKGLTSFPLAMLPEHHTKCPVEAYRAYYNTEKKHLHKWTGRNTPEWILKS